MAPPFTADAIRKELDRTTRAQADAADPRASVWVSANAGTGKTHVLTNRVLRLMLAGTAPERILCLTYTKAAAAEMSKRVFSTLSTWVTAPDDRLSPLLTALLTRAPTAAETALARTLFTCAIETPGGLKVQTIHAFCEQLLQRFPLEAGVTPGFKILDDEDARQIHRDAIEETLSAATRDRASPLGRALTLAIAHAADDRFDDVLKDAIRRRAWLDAASRMDLASHRPPFAAADALYRNALGVDPKATATSLRARQAGVLQRETMAQAATVLLAGKSTDQDIGRALAAAAAATSDDTRIAALAEALLTKDGSPRSDKRFVTKAIQEAEPGLYAALVTARDHFAAIAAEARALGVVEATVALLHLADRALQHYSEAKRRRAALDFDDLISHTASLLSRSQSAQWVLYKLDGGLDHILVDESQDTAPPQWQVIETLAQEFFSGAGARDDTRTLFAVGDEKQSIYSFQGAEPRMFAAMGARFAAMAGEAGELWRQVPLDLSFRSTAPVLEAVDAVFADRARTPGVSTGAAAVTHIARRFDKAGLVEIWPTVADDAPASADPFEPLSETAARSGVSALAARIADTIQGWLDSGERLPSEDRPLRPGDILILVRKRRPFAGAMVAALKARGIAVAGADRIRLTEQIAVADLMSLGDFLTLPEDDLALAEVLKSPLFGLDDDALLAIARGRKGALWSALLAHADTDPRFRAAAETLKRWRARADFTPPYEFFAHILDKEGMRTRLLERLGLDAADAIDEFMNLALGYDDAAPPSLSGFLVWLREGTREVKRDMDHGRDEVRVMTVHGAKGLEAPVVFLPDTCTTASAGGSDATLIALEDAARPAGTPAPWVWCVKGSARLPAIEAARAALRDAETAERNRLLYVAMTRPRDRLYVCGFESKRGRASGCWYDLIVEGLAGRLHTVATPLGDVARLVAPQSGAAETPRADTLAALTPRTPPPWARSPAPREPQLSVPLAPSGLTPYDGDADGEPVAPALRDRAGDEPPAPSPATLPDGGRFLRGTLTHALLEHLPAIPAALRPKSAKGFVTRRGAGLPRRTLDGIVREALAILGDPTFAPLFGPESRAEVPIVAELPRPTGRGPALRLTGQIDRLAVLQSSVLIVDYKTNRGVPAAVDEVADAYLFQLAAYRLALAAIFPGRDIRAALLWTDGPRLMEIPPSRLDQYAERLWALDPNRLDG
jgi:ATP-dependent helicase/nuclease subunit A